MKSPVRKMVAKTGEGVVPTDCEGNDEGLSLEEVQVLDSCSKWICGKLEVSWLGRNFGGWRLLFVQDWLVSENFVAPSKSSQ